MKMLLLVSLLVLATQCAYEPEVMLTAQPQFLNKLIANYSDTIIKTINDYKIEDPAPIEQKIQGVKVSVTLKNLKQKVDIHWITNVLEVKDRHTIKINAKNINISLHGDIQAKIGLLRKQKGPLVVTINKLETDVELLIDNPKCPNSIGFDIQVKDVFVNANAIDIKIEGKGFDNLVIKQIEKIIKPRVPGLLQKAIKQQINPLISNLTCTRVEEQIAINDKFYMLVINTSQVPSFDASLKYFQAPIDITLKNMMTNETNDELERDDLPGSSELSAGYDVSLAASSNFLNTIIWLVGDAQLLNIAVTNQMLGDDPPIALNTTNLSILLPNLKTKEWANKEVVLVVTPATKFEHLLVHSGRIVTVLSLSIKFVVNVTGDASTTDVNKCIQAKACVVGTDLNMTLPLSLALKVNSTTVLGMLHSASFYDVSIISSKIDVNVGSFKSIINSIVGSMIPSLNSQLVEGMPLPDQILNITEQYHISKMELRSYLDYLAAGLSLDL